MLKIYLFIYAVTGGVPYLLPVLQCLLLKSSEDYGSGKELGAKELDEVINNLKESMKSDIKQASVWNTLGMILLKSGRLKVKWNL